MRTGLLKITATIIVGILCSCANNSGNAESAKESARKERVSVKKAADELGLTVDKYNDLTPEVRRLRAAAIKLSSYVTLKDSTYSLDITREEAEKLGISGADYDYQCQELEKTNKAIKQMNARGETVEMLDIKALAGKIKK